MSMFKKILGANKAKGDGDSTDSAASGKKKGEASTVHLDKKDVLAALGDKSNYNKLPETVQLDKNKVRAIIEAEKKAAADREAAAKKATEKSDQDG